MTELEKRLGEALRGLMRSEHVSQDDLVYQVREREMEGWEGPAVIAWSNAVTEAKAALEAFEAASHD